MKNEDPNFPEKLIDFAASEAIPAGFDNWAEWMRQRYALAMALFKLPEVDWICCKQQKPSLPPEKIVVKKNAVRQNSV